MGEPNKKPGVAFWATVVVVVVLVAYPLSWGPAAWICTGLGDPQWAVNAYLRIYAPLLWMDERSPESIRDATTWYCSLLP